MDSLLKEIRRVQRRLVFQRFLGVLGWCWFATLFAAAIVVAAARFYPLHVVDWQWLAGFAAAGLLAAVGWTFWARTPALQAALEIDHRFGLKERVSSTLAMHPADRESVAGQALVADADARLRRIAVLEKFPVRPPRHLLLPLLPVVLLAAVMIFRPPMKETVATGTETGTPPVEVKKSAEELRQKLAVLRKQAEEKGGLKDASELLKKIEEGTNELQKQPDREKALAKLNDLGRELQERRKQLGGSGETLKRELEKVEPAVHGPADEFAKALAKDDFEKAANALEKLQNQLANSKLDPGKKEELTKQLEQLQQKINQMAQEVKKAQDDLKDRAKQANQPGGDAAAAAKLEDAIQKLQQQGQQMQAMQDVANKLGQCANQMKQGQDGQAAQSMHDALQQMQQMAQQQAELKTLEGAMQQLADARQQMNCEGGDCPGGGNDGQKGQGAGNKSMLAGGGDGEGKGKPGQGLRKGKGDGARPDAKADGSFFDSKVSQDVRAGAGQITGLTGGPNLRNQAEADIQKAAAEIEHGGTDPLSGQRLPKKQSEHAQQYFDSFREGK